MKLTKTFSDLVEFLHTTHFSDDTHMTISVFDCGHLDNDGVIKDSKFFATVTLENEQNTVLYLLVKARDKTPYFFRTLDPIINDLLWKRDSTLHMQGHFPIDGVNDYFY